MPTEPALLVEVFDESKQTTQHFYFLLGAMQHAAEKRITGTIVTVDGEVIEIRRGKRRSVTGKRWVSCAPKGTDDQG